MTQCIANIDYLSIAKKVFDLEAQYISQQKHLLDDTFVKAVELLLSAKGRIITSGIGKSGIVARKIAATFSSIGKASFFLNAGEASHGDLGMIRLDDVVLVLSNSGESTELGNIIHYCKKHNIPIIAILSNIRSILYDMATVSILFPSDCEVSHIKVPTTSTTLMSIIGDALAVSIVEATKITYDEYKDYHPGGSIGSSLCKVKNVMRKGSAIPFVSQNMLMSEALLIMTNKALGCLVAIDKSNKLVGVVTDGDLRRHIFEDLINLRVSKIMTQKPLLISKDAFVGDALEMMNKNAKTSLIIAENGIVEGVIHIHDCLRANLAAVHS